MSRRHGSYDKFSLPLSLIRTIFPNKDALVTRTKAINQSHWEANSFVTDFRHLWELALAENGVQRFSSTARIFHTFSVSDACAPCHPIKVTHFERPLDRIHLFQYTRELTLKSRHFTAITVGRSLNKALSIFWIREFTLEGNNKIETREGSTIRAHRWEEAERSAWKCLSCQPSVTQHFPSPTPPKSFLCLVLPHAIVTTTGHL